MSHAVHESYRHFMEPTTLKANTEDSFTPFAKIAKVALGVIAILASYVLFTPEVALGLSVIIGFVTLISAFDAWPKNDSSYNDGPARLPHRKRYFPRFVDIFTRRPSQTRTSGEPYRRPTVRNFHPVIRTSDPAFRGTRAPMNPTKPQPNKDSGSFFSGTRAPTKARRSGAAPSRSPHEREFREFARASDPAFSGTRAPTKGSSRAGFTKNPKASQAGVRAAMNKKV